ASCETIKTSNAQQGGQRSLAPEPLRGEPMILLVRGVLPALALLAASLLPAPADDSFPFGSTLMLDAAPMRGSKRVPMLEIAENGAAAIDLWCASASAQAVIGDHSISIAPGAERAMRA